MTSKRAHIKDICSLESRVDFSYKSMKAKESE